MSPPSHRAGRSLAVVMISLMIASGVPGPASGADREVLEGAHGWHWPIDPVRVVRAYEAPAHAYGPGHRGIDLDASVSGAALAPAAGVVAFSGPVAGRGILTIAHVGGLVTTLEPVESELAPGTTVAAGDIVGEVGRGGHAARGSLHFGVRLDGEYINPMLMLGGVPRAVLLPCC